MPLFNSSDSQPIKVNERKRLMSETWTSFKYLLTLTVTLCDWEFGKCRSGRISDKSLWSWILVGQITRNSQALLKILIIKEISAKTFNGLVLLHIKASCFYKPATVQGVSNKCMLRLMHRVFRDCHLRKLVLS